MTESSASSESVPSIHLLGVRVNMLQIPDVIGRMEEWIRNRDGTHYITLTNVHSVVEAQHNAAFREVLCAADLSVPDGMPLVWLGRSRGHSLRRRVYGPDLLWDFCKETHQEGFGHFFYGGAPGVAEALIESLRSNCPLLKIVGTYSPPFRPLTPEEDGQIVETINRAAPEILWVGLGCPKQERWMYEHRQRLQVPVMVGVGQAFDIYAGRIRQAPRWMRESGFEWLFRLFHEPRRLWKRYLVYNTEFIVCLFLEKIGWKRFE
ncbi:MAG: WecB/TagA/CpsF family glycosyltransferase [Acidobacteria bacterium]|nr:WecB/TagA/CpsF family glycosyltransferase [Acidobacteriota bacterium]